MQSTAGGETGRAHARGFSVGDSEGGWRDREGVGVGVAGVWRGWRVGSWSGVEGRRRARREARTEPKQLERGGVRGV